MVSISVSDAFHAMLNVPGPMAYKAMSISAPAVSGCLRRSKVETNSNNVIAHRLFAAEVFSGSWEIPIQV